MSGTREQKSESAEEKPKHVVRQFCDNTTIHGLKYVTESGSLLIERVMWLLLFLTGIAFSTYFCVIMWRKWEDSPVLISVDTQVYPLKKISFPAVTICNVNKVSRKKLVELLPLDPKFSNITFSRLQTTLSYMTKLDRAINNDKQLNDLSQYYSARNITPVDLFRLLDKTAPSCGDMIMDCNWLGLTRPCMEFFSFLPTDDGMCCTFNGGKYLDSELGIESKPSEPLRVNGNGYRMGLSLVIDAKVDDYGVTNGKFDGFKVLVHSPEQFPDVSDRGFVMGPGTETFAGVKGSTSFNTDAVADKVSFKKRNCLVEGEKNLTYFTEYSLSACFVECATKKMEELCKCRPYFFKGDNKTRLCEMNKYRCISNIYEDVRSRGDEICVNCLPSCSETWYVPEVSYANFPGHGFTRTRTFKRLAEARNITANQSDHIGYFKSNVAMLHVYFKEKTGVRYSTDVRFGVEDFISAMGGLLGLGVGVSFVSIVELFYYIFFRRLFLWFRSKYSSSSYNNNKVGIDNPEHVSSL